MGALGSPLIYDFPLEGLGIPQHRRYCPCRSPFTLPKSQKHHLPSMVTVQH